MQSLSSINLVLLLGKQLIHRRLVPAQVWHGD